ncbi:sporulation protein [Streptomyces sp. NBC_01565]|uniref:sporulation protein n=1 Tax=Streptomyces sp. NBC_01565 TaxID=2975881 RepID=UPI002B1CC8DE|nr:sporulation protein [Streptomyces sp. NBC_01565]
MVFKRLLGKGGIPLEVNTIVQSEPARPGGLLTGEVVLRAPERAVELNGIDLTLLYNPPQVRKGGGEGAKGDTIDHIHAQGYFTLDKGAERRVPFEHRLRWETPVSETRGRKLSGIDLFLNTGVRIEGSETQRDFDPVHVTTLPLHEAVLDGFTAAGYDYDRAAVNKLTIPDVEWHLYLRQTFLLAGPRPLELTFHTNAVGSEIFLREADRRHTSWEDKPPALRFVAAHHEVGHREFTEETRRWISGLDPLGQATGGGS